MRGYAAIAAYWTATFRGQLDDGELAVFERVLADTEVEDAVAVIDDVASTGGFPPTPQRIAELADVHRKERLRNLALMETEVRQIRGANAPVSFAVWLREYATEDEKRLVAKNSPGLRKKFGGDLASLDSPVDEKAEA